jgi:hypothetical protein
VVASSWIHYTPEHPLFTRANWEQYYNHAQFVNVISFPPGSACLIFFLHENTFRPLGSSRFYHTNKIRCTAKDILQTANSSVLAAQDVYRRPLDCWDRGVRILLMVWKFVTSFFVKADSHIACRAHVVPLPCRAAKRLECVFPIWFTQCGRVWFTLAMPRPCHALTMQFFSRPRHSTAVKRRPVSYLSASVYHAKFHEDCYQKRTNPPHNDPYLRL